MRRLVAVAAASFVFVLIVSLEIAGYWAASSAMTFVVDRFFGGSLVVTLAICGAVIILLLLLTIPLQREWVRQGRPKRRWYDFL